MGNTKKGLNTLQIKNAKPKEKPYKLYDFGGLFVLVNPTGSKIFKIKYRFNRKENIYTIGKFPIVSLSEAREELIKVKKWLKEGKDPNQEKKSQQLAQLPFKSIIEEFLTIKAKDVSPKRLRGNYTSPINYYILPFIGDKPIQEITKDEIVKIVQQVPKIKVPNTTKESGKTYKAREVFNILKMIFKYALHKGYIPYSIVEQIDINAILPVHKKEHIKAITDDRIKILYKAIRSNEGLSYWALEFLALTAVRPSNIRNLKWGYVDFENMLIVYPKEDMKIKKSDFRLPITPRLFEILKLLEKLQTNEFVFNNPSTNKPISDTGLRKTLHQTLGFKDHSLHGFRSSFKTIATERQKEHGYSFEAIEAQLHHDIGNSVVKSYLRSDFLEERRKLLLWWENYLNS